MSDLLVILGGIGVGVIIIFTMILAYSMLEDYDTVRFETLDAPVTIPAIISTLVVVLGIVLFAISPMFLLKVIGVMILLGIAAGIVFVLTKFIQVIWVQFEDSPRIQRILDAWTE